MSEVCQACGFAVDVRRVAVMVNGRYELELHLCPDCRLRLLEPLERAAVDVMKRGRASAASAFLREPSW